ncbi:MAG: hypothetical protein ABI776_04370 [Nocardioidaceae bacterium]
MRDTRFRRWSTLRKTAVVTLTAGALAAAGTLAVAGQASAGTDQRTVLRNTGSATGLGQLSGLLPRNKLTEQSAINVNLSKETVRLPLYKGKAGGETVWYLLLDASDQGLAEDLGVNYVPKLQNMAINCASCVQTVHLEQTTPQDNRFGTAAVDFPGAPDFSPTRIAVPGKDGFPLDKFQPGAVGGPNYSPFIRIAGSPVVYNAPIVAVGDDGFDVDHHTNTADRVLGIHLAGKASTGTEASGRYADNWADVLFVKGFDAGQPIVYLSTDAGQPLTAVLERATYVPALDKAAYAGGDDFLGSARERLFGFINGQTGKNNPQAQGFTHLGKDGGIERDASSRDRSLISGLRKGGDLLNVFGDFPTLTDPRHSSAYSPLWDAQLGLWSPKAVRLGLNKRQIDENQVLNLAATRPDLLTGVDPATGQPTKYGSVGVTINCAVIGFTRKAPTAGLAAPVPFGQFPPL